MARIVRVFACVALVSAGSCALRQEKVEQRLQSPGPVNCTTAEGDLRVLQAEKVNLAQRIAEGVTAITPAGVVLGAAAGTERTELKVATGEYNKMIDARIAEIVQTCGIGGY
jgi:hypothetical protein